MTNLLLGFHLLGAVCFIVGGIVAGVLQLRAMRQERPSEVYRFLRRAPIGAALVGTGALLTLGFGIALAEHKGLGLSPAWIQASVGLWVAAMALGAYGGRTARRARHLAERLAAEGDEPSPELRALVSARGPLGASFASFALVVAIVALMVWQPGGQSEAAYVAAVLKTVQPQVARDSLGYLPTRLPSGVTRVIYRSSGPNEGFQLNILGKHALVFAVSSPPLCLLPKPTATDFETLTVNGQKIGWDARDAFAWRCIHRASSTVEILASSLGGVERDDLAAAVAYAEPIR